MYIYLRTYIHKNRNIDLIDVLSLSIISTDIHYDLYFY
jgi:hypothetical protein